MVSIVVLVHNAIVSLFAILNVQDAKPFTKLEIGRVWLTINFSQFLFAYRDRKNKKELMEYHPPALSDEDTLTTLHQQ